jgi:hypothetical protein
VYIAIISTCDYASACAEITEKYKISIFLVMGFHHYFFLALSVIFLALLIVKFAFLGKT